ncbi:uncharacterized protein [Coffea arabica]|uniref:ATP-dependent DNA helicase n=1 Tax=Coffea arabica TaxID=13443 RepID=A0ABM4VM38_COFAR
MDFQQQESQQSSSVSAMAKIDNDPNFVYVREYYAYKFQIRDDNESFLLHFARLIQQFIVDMELLAERSITVHEEDLNAISLLNEKQRHAFEIISHRIYENKSGAFFVDGPGGTEKSFLYRALLADVRSKGYLALATATLGIATSILPGGRTAYSRFKIPIDLLEGRACRVSKQSNLAAMIRESKLTIWDEAPMS